MATEPEYPSKEISRIEKTPAMQVGDRVYSRYLQDVVEIKKLNQDHARIRMQNREYDVPTSDLRPRVKDFLSRSRGGGGGGGMVPDVERVPGKKQLKMKKGGMIKSSASKRADGCAKRGKTKCKMV